MVEQKSTERPAGKTTAERRGVFAENAQYYLKRGISIFPTKSNKKPAIPAVIPFRTARADAGQIADWSRDLGGMNVAAVCGRLSDLFVVDADSPEAAAKVDSLIPERCPAPSATTPKGGRHFYFRHAPGFENWVRCRKDIDIRTERGYVLLPPSSTRATPDGKCVDGKYLQFGDGDIKDRAPLPEGLAAFLREGKSEGARIQDKETPPLTLGRRANDIFKICCVLTESNLPRDLVDETARNLGKGCAPPLDEKEALEHAAGAWKRCHDKTLHEEIPVDGGELVPEPLGEAAPAPQPAASAGKRDLRNLIRTLKEVREQALASPPAPLWAGFLYRGMLHLFAGLPKTGKTTLWVWVTALLTRDDTTEILGRAAAGGLKLLLITEEHGYTLSEGLIEAGADESKINVMTANDFRLLGEKDRAAVRDIIVSLAPDVVVIDTLTKAHKIKDENDNAQMTEAIQPWVNFAHDTGIAVFTVHQHRKSGGQYGTEVRGGGAMEAVDVYWNYRRGELGRPTERKLGVMGRYMGKDNALEGEVLTVEWDGKDFMVDTGIRDGIMGTDKKRLTFETIRGLVEREEPITRKSVWEALPRNSMSTMTLKRHLVDLQNEGILEQPGGGRTPYRLTERGRRRHLSGVEWILEGDEQ